jgi:putative hemin transport protein
VSELQQRYHALKSEKPKLRIRDAASELGVSEAELVACDGGIRLEADWSELVLELPTLGHVMALTRNEQAVSEVKGHYGNISFFHAGMGQVLGKAIDLRLFMGRWKYGFAVVGQESRSLQFFDASGTAVHKVHFLADSNREAFDALVAKYRVDGSALTVEPATLHEKEQKPDAAVDVEGLRAGWDAMRDTHEFFPLIKRAGVTRRQALRLVGEPRAKRVQNTALNAVLERAAATELPIMLFVGNPGVLQVRSGPVVNIQRLGPWLNVMDPDFNLHLREDLIDQSWVVEKPTAAGAVSSLELFAADGSTIAMLFVKRDDREKAENPVWRDILAALPA